MKRLLILTVGKTHSGKSSFARALAGQFSNALVIDQDKHADFINTHYRALLPEHGPNTLKYSITQTIVDYAVKQSDAHLILCNANRAQTPRVKLLETFHARGFTSILVHFDIPDEVLAARVAKTKRSTTIFRHASSFEELLSRQQADENDEAFAAPSVNEAHHYFSIKSDSDSGDVIREIVRIASS